ncbi:MAG: hypothetical protein QOG15_3702 [Solirubrobacteraceae bacterium]|jgi:HSP20 family protein|nr:hypothetical protein [Solirubrobacteraceae bacterium]
MATMVQPYAPWMQDLTRFLTQDSAVGAFIPPADVLIDDEGVSVWMDVPGLRSEDLDIELEHEVLTIRGQRPYPYDNDRCKAMRIERRFGRFERTLRVPRGLDADAIEASLAEGVLHMRVPQPAENQPHKIEIKAGDADTIDATATDAAPADRAAANGDASTEGAAANGQTSTGGSAEQGAPSEAQNAPA